MEAKWYHDPALYEYLSTDTFWLLGIALCANAYWVTKQLESLEKARNTPDEPNQEPGETATAQADNGVNDSPFARWLRPRLTSRPREMLASFVFGLIFPLQLLEGFWVLKTTWRLTSAALWATYPRVLRPRILGFVLYSPATAFMLFSWAAVLLAGVFLLASQYLLVNHLWEGRFSSRARAGSLSSERRRKSDDWDELNDSDEVQIGGDETGGKKKAA